MKTITIRLPNVEAAMLVEMQKRSKDFRNLQEWFAEQIKTKHANMQKNSTNGNG